MRVVERVPTRVFILIGTQKQHMCKKYNPHGPSKQIRTILPVPNVPNDKCPSWAAEHGENKVWLAWD
jgi:hypothetical protein